MNEAPAILPAGRTQTANSHPQGGEADGGLRLFMPMWSRFENQAYRAACYEAQDILAACATTEQVCLEPDRSFALKTRHLMRLAHHDFTGLFRRLNPGLKPVSIANDQNLFVMVCPYWRDLRYANAISGWRKKSAVTVCWIDELWTRDIPEVARWKHVLDQFDHIFVGIDGTAEQLAKTLGRPCHFLPGAVDVLRFTPFPRPPTRSIDVYSIGRRVTPVHQSLLQMARSTGIYYLHDTLQSGDSAAFDYRAHREMYANTAKRSRLFMVAPAKVDMPQHTGRQTDLGFRCYEGAAAGAVLVGQPPDSELFRRLFHWPDAVVPLKPDGSDTAEVVGSLLNDPERLQRIRLRNCEEMLRHHDWMHRWKTIFDTAGLPLTPAMQARLDRMENLADQIRALR